MVDPAHPKPRGAPSPPTATLSPSEACLQEMWKLLAEDDKPEVIVRHCPPVTQVRRAREVDGWTGLERGVG